MFEDYFKDKYNVYYKGKILEGVDLKTFSKGECYYRDKNSVYFRGEKIEGVDMATLKEHRAEVSPGPRCFGEDSEYEYQDEKRYLKK